MVSVRKLVVTTVLIGVLVGCGGGGGSSDPVLGTITFSTLQNAPLQGQVTATDPGGATLTFSKTSNPASGTLTAFQPSGAFIYVPNATFTGSDSFGIQVSDAAGHSTTGTVTITVKVDHAPVAGNVILRADGGALASVNVLANTTHPDGGALTVKVSGTPFPSGTKISVNTDQSVGITPPAGFIKGLMNFTFTVTDASGMAANAAAAVFVGTDPFRAAFVGDASANGSYEVYLTDFAAAPAMMSSASHGTTRLRGFAAADSGKTIAYRSQDTATNASSLTFVQSSAPATQVPIALPGSAIPTLSPQGTDQFRVSPDGQWIALVAGQGNTSSVYIVNVGSASTVTPVAPSGSVYAEQLSFTPDSKGLYFLASSVPPANNVATNRSLYFVDLAVPGTVTLMSVLSAPGTADDVVAYEVSQDQTSIGLEANRAGALGLFFVNPAHPAQETKISHAFALDEVLYSSTLTLPQGSGGGADGRRVAYTTINIVSKAPSTLSAFVAEVSAMPKPRPITNNGAVALAVRPDDAAVLYSKGGNVYENIVDSGAATDQVVGGGTDGWYDSTGNIVLLSSATVVPGTSTAYPVLASTTRASPFTAPQLVDGGTKAVVYNNVSGFDRAVAIIAEGP
ncbi:MAG: cadherin-like domain-containing protein, partial [Sinobacteraceae bacterium]|nr:cadherin-like domain-containing protein [Nevskiaceae bacterium]